MSSPMSPTSASSEKFYNRFAALYPVIDFFLKPQKKKFFEQVNALPSGQLLDIGIGNGSNLKYYHKHRITGIDTSTAMLAEARKHASHETKLHLMNGELLAFADRSFDYVILSHVLAVVTNPEQLLLEIHRVLKTNGQLLILNHVTPDNYLKYFDKAVQKISQWVHVKSAFHPESLDSLKQFRLLKQYDASAFSYFKVLIYEKSL